MNKLVISNLVHRPIRTLISIVAIAIEVILILLIVGLSLGMLNDAAERQKGVGADIMVMPPNASQFSALNGAPMPIKIGDVIAKLPHVAAVSGVVGQTTTSGSFEVITGIDLDSYNRIGAPFRFLAGGPFTGPDQVLVDDYIAGQNHLRVGDKINVLNHDVTVAGIVQHGKGGRKFLPRETMQSWIGAQGKASVIYVKVDDPVNIKTVVDEIRNYPGLQGYTVRTMEEATSMMTADNVPALNTFIKVVIAIAVIIGFIVIFQAMYTAVMERTREIGILKSLGATKLYIVRAILRETILLAIVGIAVGIGVSFAARAALRARFPLLPIQITTQWLVLGTLIAIAGAILGALYPAFKAAQKDPIDALAYE
jgi:putative ABC transport system permease protein